MALLIRAPLTSFDDDDEGYASSLSSGAASPSRSPSTSPPVAQPRPLGAAVLGAPRVAAQLSSSTDDEADLFDDAAGSSGDEVLEEVSNGFFRIARVPPPPPSPSSDEATAPSPASAAGGGSASSGESEYFGAAEGTSEEEAAADVFVDAGTGSGLEEDGSAGTGNRGAEGSLDGSFLSSMSVLDDGAALGDLVNLSDVSVMNGGQQGGEDVVGAEAVDGVEPEPSTGDAGGTPIVDALEENVGGSEKEVVELPPAVNSTEEEDAGLQVINADSDATDTKHEVAELPHVVSSTEAEATGPEIRNADSDAEHTTPKHEVVTHSEDDSPEHVATRDATVEPVEVHTNVDSSQFTVDAGHHKVDGETDGDYEPSDEPASVPIIGTNNALESPGKEMEDNVPASKGTRFGLDDSDEDQLDDDYEVEELSGKETELFDYAALAELLRAANRSPAQGKAKVFPVETSDSVQPSHTVVGVPRTSVASTHVVDAVADPESAMTDEEKKLYIKVDMARIKYSMGEAKFFLLV